ncbi:macrophage mannose receptor 1-like [Strongylocentrotus purpuratus]|uniref:C-type lectin domain-containing protein n=1 Tax=Strongylocentrotus purpuratus TaxID=7668 RepID=A0A7M7P6S5_STRPU|nr:macrophage mannose receptor 1-like [Strongylocentrotus purpuratus]
MLTPGVVLVYVIAHHGMTSFHGDLRLTFVSVHENDTNASSGQRKAITFVKITIYHITIHSQRKVCFITVFDGSSEASFGGLDYFISPSWLARSFSDARTYCQYHGADLALIKSHDINTFLRDRISGLSNYVFFGLTDQAVEGTFTWIDGTPLQYSAWRDPEPNGGDNEDCVTLSSDLNLGWNDIPCNLDHPFICERYQDVPEYEWSRFDGTLYYISQSSMTSYTFARRFCQAQGGDLAQPKTEEINMHLMKLAGGNSYWFGLDDSSPEGTFQWIDRTSLDNNEFPAWSNGDATLFESERCVHQQVNNGWRKLPCTSYLRFACEKAPILLHQQC